MKLKPDEVQKFCQVNPIDMLLGTGHCDHGEDCATCQYLFVNKYLNSKKVTGPEVKQQYDYRRYVNTVQ